MITHVIVELKYPVEDEYFHMDTVFPNEYYGYGTPLIRCKDCQYWMQNPFREYPREFGLCFKHKDIAIASDETDWCSWAERKEG